MTGHDDELERGRRDAGARSGEPISIEAFHGLAAAYALDALDHDERAEFERALAASPELRDEVDAYAESAAHLAEQAEPVAPPPSLKARLMAELDSTPQVGSGCRTRRIPRGRGARSLGRARCSRRRVPTSAAAGSDRTVGRAESTARRRWFQRPGAIIGAAAAAVVLIAGAIIGIGWTGPNGWGAQREMAAIAEAPDAQSQTLEVEGGGEVTLVSSADQGRSGVIVEGLPELGADQTYELWYIDDAGADSAGTFDVSGSETWRVLDGSFTPGVAVGITVEPAGGSPQPTTEPIVVIAT